jgi:hypothetical protein
MKHRLIHLPVASFCLLGIIWGSNFIYMKLASRYITPTQIVFFRVLFGFVPVMFYAGFIDVLRWKHLRHAGHFFVMALLATTIYYYGFAKGTSLLLSGVAGAVSGAIPLFSFLLAIECRRIICVCKKVYHPPQNTGSGFNDLPVGHRAAIAGGYHGFQWRRQYLDGYACICRLNHRGVFTQTKMIIMLNDRYIKRMS